MQSHGQLLQPFAWSILVAMPRNCSEPASAASVCLIFARSASSSCEYCGCACTICKSSKLSTLNPLGGRDLASTSGVATASQKACSSADWRFASDGLPSSSVSRLRSVCELLSARRYAALPARHSDSPRRAQRLCWRCGPQDVRFVTSASPPGCIAHFSAQLFEF